MPETKPRGPTFWGVLAVAAYVVGCWIALAVMIDLGALGAVLLFDRYHLLALALTSAEQAWWLWAGGLAFALACYAAGVYRAATWFAIVPEITAAGRAAGRRRAEPPQAHEIPKTGPSPEEIARRGMPRG